MGKIEPMLKFKYSAKDNRYTIKKIGDNTIKGIPVPTHAIIAELTKSIGFEWFGYYKYKIKDHRTSIPRANKAQKIEYEYVLMLKKR